MADFDGDYYQVVIPDFAKSPVVAYAIAPFPGQVSSQSLAFSSGVIAAVNVPVHPGDNNTPGASVDFG
jgi:hypothetical protein